MAAKLRDIAEKAGTSIAAVSVTLNGAKSKTSSVGPETRQRILRVANELGYRRNPTAGALATGRTSVLGLMLPSLNAYGAHDPFYTAISNGASASASASGYNLMLYTATAEDQGPRAADLIDKRIDGLILVSPPKGSLLYDECDRLEIPVVTILGEPRPKGLSVGSDDFSGGRLAARHLANCGHRRFGVLLGKPEVATTEPRREGFMAGLREMGLEPDVLVGAGHFNRQDGYRATSQWMALPADQRPTAIFAHNDLSAHGAIDAIHDAGLDVPGDVSIVGYDDTWYSVVVRPTLTTVNMAVHEIGHTAADLLITFLAGGAVADAHPILPVSLVLRESTAMCRFAPSSP